MEKRMVEDVNLKKRIEENKPLVDSSKENTRLILFWNFFYFLKDS